MEFYSNNGNWFDSIFCSDFFYLFISGDITLIIIVKTDKGQVTNSKQDYLYGRLFNNLNWNALWHLDWARMV
jgi:hypothetical protein